MWIIVVKRGTLVESILCDECMGTMNDRPSIIVIAAVWSYGDSE
jgi:hypothetical protein